MKELSQDFLSVLHGSRLHVYKLTGLRNYPQNEFKAEKQGTEDRFDAPELFMPKTLCDLFIRDDVLQLRALSRDGRLAQF